jgi:hypothetical protein
MNDTAKVHFLKKFKIENENFKCKKKLLADE